MGSNRLKGHTRADDEPVHGLCGWHYQCEIGVALNDRGTARARLVALVIKVASTTLRLSSAL